MNKDPIRISDVLGDAAREVGVKDARAAGRIARLWEEIAGPEMARHVEPSSLKDGTLRLRADSPVWATEIGYLAEDIRGRVNDALGRPAVECVTVFSAPADPRAGSRRQASRPPAPRPPSSDPEAVPEDPREALENAHRAWAARWRKRAF